jgi:Na+-driven multidrug efflux pump
MDKARTQAEFKKAVRKGQLLEISFGIIAGVLVLILSPWLARLLTHVEGWSTQQVNMFWLWLIVGCQTLYWFWRLWRFLMGRGR